MGGNRAVRATLVSSLCLTGLLYGCAGAPEKPPAPTGAHATEAAADKELLCAHRPYGQVKNGTVEKSLLPAAADSTGAPPADNASAAGKILIQSQPLDVPPPEIVRIQRGLVKRFVGKFVKDGVTTWTGVDLDRLVAVAIERRVFDRNAHQPRPVADPRFSQQGGSSFARKWSEPGRTEVEVVSIFPLSLAEAQTFVCAANSEWAAKAPPPDDDSDEMSEGATDFFLLDRRAQQDVSYRYAKTIELGEGLAAVLALIWEHAPVGPAW